MIRVSEVIDDKLLNTLISAYKDACINTRAWQEDTYIMGREDGLRYVLKLLNISDEELDAMRKESRDLYKMWR